jgi:hypothetical protein
MKRMGNAGLFNSGASKLIAPRGPTIGDWRNGFQRSPEQVARDAEDDRIGSVLDNVPFFYNGSVSDNVLGSAFNNPHNPDWKTSYRREYASFGHGGDLNPLNGYPQQYYWDGSNPATRGGHPGDAPPADWQDARRGGRIHGATDWGHRLDLRRLRAL